MENSLACRGTKADTVQSLCTSAGCHSSALICGNSHCSCHRDHHDCHTQIRLKKMFKAIKNTPRAIEDTMAVSQSIDTLLQSSLTKLYALQSLLPIGQALLPRESHELDSSIERMANQFTCLWSGHRTQPIRFYTTVDSQKLRQLESALTNHVVFQDRCKFRPSLQAILHLIAKSTSITKLQIEDEVFADQLAVILEKMTSLVHLSLVVNCRNGVAQLIDKMTQVRLLKLESGPNIRPPLLCLSKLSYLTVLSLSRIQLTSESLRQLTKLMRLSSLTLKQNVLTKNELVEVCKLTQLYHLAIIENRLDDAAVQIIVNAFSRSNLQELILCNYHLYDQANFITPQGILLLKTLTKLKLLNVALNPQLSNAGVQPIYSMRKLESLDLSRLPLSQIQGIQRLTELHTLDLSHNRTEPKELVYISYLKKLRVLRLAYTPVREMGIKAIGTMKSLTELHLAGNGIDAEGSRHLINLTNLTILSYEYNRISRETACGIAELTQLKQLRLVDLFEYRTTQYDNEQDYQIPITREQLDIVRQCCRSVLRLSQIETLSIQKVVLEDEGVHYLSRCASITTLHIEYNKISDCSIPSLRRMSSLRDLICSKTLDTNGDMLSLQGQLTLKAYTDPLKMQNLTL